MTIKLVASGSSDWWLSFPPDVWPRLEDLREAGAMWDRENKLWRVDVAALERLKALWPVVDFETEEAVRV